MRITYDTKLPTLVGEEVSGEAVLVTRPKKQNNALLLSGRTSVPTGFSLRSTVGFPQYKSEVNSRV
jgi:hypothetical protein